MPDLINITSLLRTDTFNQWFVTTNEIIDALNPVNIYDAVGGDGIQIITGTGDAGEYNGVIDINVDEGPGIDFDSANRAIVGFRLYNTEGVVLGPTGSSGNISAVVNWYDQVIVNDQGAPGATDGTAKAVMAGYMLPADILIDDITFHGNVNINGNFSVGGSDATIRSNDLRIEDEQIELAYIEKVSFQITGATAGSFAAGQTAYYDDTAGSASGQTASLDAIGVVAAYQYVAGPTAYVEIRGPFVKGGVEDFEINGYLAASGGTNEYQLYTTPGLTTDWFRDDEYRNPPGFVVRGASGHKSWLWDEDSDAFLSNRNIGSTAGGVYAHRFCSLPSYGASSGLFEFHSDLNTAKIRMKTTGIIGDPSSWEWRLPQSGYGLRFAAGTADNLPSASYGFHIHPGFDIANLGVTYGSNPNCFAEDLNVDMLDGAHAGTTATAYRIPVALSTGKIDDSWINAIPYVAEDIGQNLHGFATGDVIRITATGHYTKASAATPEYAEVVGMVSEIIDADNFKVTFSGRVTDLDNITNYPLVTGSVYFLSSTVDGAIISDPDSGIGSGQVRKAVLLASDKDRGYVLPYMGILESETTDQVEIRDLVPIGMIVPFSGENVPNRWLLCDGYFHSQSNYARLFATVGKIHHNLAKQFNRVTNDLAVLYFNADHGFEIGDTVKSVFSNGDSIDELDVVSVSNSGSTYVIGVKKTGAFSKAYYTALDLQPLIYPATSSTKFFVPNLSGRVALGSGINNISGDSVNRSVANVGGSESHALNVEEMPYHAHTLPSSVGVLSGSDINVLSESGILNESGYSGGTADNTTLAHENMPPYVAMKYIIRAKPETDAFILTGHNHDNHYIRYNIRHESPASNDLTESNRETFRHNARVAGMPAGHDNATGFEATGGTHNHDSRYVRIDSNVQGNTTQEKQNARDNIDVWSKVEGLYRFGNAGGGMPENSTMYGTVYWDHSYGGLSGYNSDWALDLNRDYGIAGVKSIGMYGSSSADEFVEIRNGLTFSVNGEVPGMIGNVSKIEFRDSGTIYNLGTLDVLTLTTSYIEAQQPNNRGLTFSHRTNFPDELYASEMLFLDGSLKRIKGFNTIDGDTTGRIIDTQLSNDVRFNIPNLPNSNITYANNQTLTFVGYDATDNSATVFQSNITVKDSAGNNMITYDHNTLGGRDIKINGNTDIEWITDGGGILGVQTIRGRDVAGINTVDLDNTRIIGQTGGIDDDHGANVDQVRRFTNVGAAVLGGGLLGTNINNAWESYVNADPASKTMADNKDDFSRNAWMICRVDGLSGDAFDTASYQSTILHMQFPMAAFDDGSLSYSYSTGGKIPSDELAGNIQFENGSQAYPYPSDFDAIHKAPISGFAKYRIGNDAYLYVDMSVVPGEDNVNVVKLALGASDGSSIDASNLAVVKFVVGNGSGFPGTF